MRIIKFLGVIMILTCSLAASAQVKIKFGKVSQAELTKEKSTIEESAAAEVLGEFGSLGYKLDNDLNIYYELEVHKRIKIYNSTGYDYADIRIPFYSGSGTDKVSVDYVKGATYNLENGKQVKIKLTNDLIVTEDQSRYTKVKKITFPQVKEGSVIEYKYTLTSNRIGDLPDWTFQESIPVVWSQYTYSIPEWFNFTPIGQGYLPYEVNKTSSITGTSASLPGATWTENKKVLAVKNAVPLKNEAYISSKNNYISKINFQLSSYRYPGGPYIEVSNTYGSYNKRLMRSDGFGGLLDKGGFLNESTQQLTQGMENVEKAIKLYTHVRNTMTWNKYRGQYPGNIRKAWKEKNGSVATINFILTLMLKQAGLNAEPIILSTRSNGMLHPAFPNTDRFDYLIAAVKLDGKWILLDATAKGYPFGTLPIKCLNGRGWMVSATQAGWIPLQNSKPSGEISQVSLNLAENGVLTGKMSIASRGYVDIARRINLQSKGEEAFAQSANEEMEFWELDSMAIENADNNYASLKTTCIITNAENEDSEYIYLNPVVTSTFERNPFQDENRVMPVDFPYNINNRYVMEITLPEGYVVDEIPKPVVFQLPGRAAQFQFSVTHMNDKINVINNLKINKLFFSVEEYEGLKKFFELMISKQEEQIVIKKI